MTADLAKKIEETKAKAEQTITTCIKEVGVDEEVAKKLKFGDFSVRDEKAKVCPGSSKALLEFNFNGSILI